MLLNKLLLNFIHWIDFEIGLKYMILNSIKLLKLKLHFNMLLEIWFKNLSWNWIEIIINNFIKSFDLKSN